MEKPREIDQRNYATIRVFYGSASFLVNITMERSEGRRRGRHTQLANAKKGRKHGRKRKRKNGTTTNLQQQEQQ